MSDKVMIYAIVGAIVVAIYGVLRYTSAKKKYNARGGKNKPAQRRRR